MDNKFEETEKKENVEKKEEKDGTNAGDSALQASRQVKPGPSSRKNTGNLKPKRRNISHNNFSEREASFQSSSSHLKNPRNVDNKENLNDHRRGKSGQSSHCSIWRKGVTPGNTKESNSRPKAFPEAIKYKGSNKQPYQPGLLKISNRTLKIRTNTRKRKLKTSRKNFYNMSLYPEAQDLKTRNSISRNITKGSYDGPDHYLDVQFRLLREDFMDPLRTGIQQYKNSLVSNKTEKIFDIRLYKNVKFVSISYSKENPDKLSFKIQMNKKYATNIDWSKSKRLMYGSLCLFSTDNFENFLVGVVSEREIDDLEEGEFSVYLIDENPFGFDLYKMSFVMAESCAFFEPVYQVLDCIQQLYSEELPMERYLLVKDIVVQKPQYLKATDLCHSSINEAVQSQKFQNLLLLIDKGLENNKDDKIDGCEVTNCNDSQARALRAALTSDFSVIQGPPGTGKTYVGLIIVKSILDCFSLNSPIMIVCFTNHALDQFLEGLLSYTRDVVRLGGQSKNPALKKITFKNKKSSLDKSSFYLHLRDLRNDLNELAIDIIRYESVINCIEPANSFGVINLFAYKEINFRGMSSFENSSDFIFWLFDDYYEFIYYFMRTYKLPDDQEYDVRDEFDNLIHKYFRMIVNSDDEECQNYFDCLHKANGIQLNYSFTKVDARQIYSIVSDYRRQYSPESGEEEVDLDFLKAERLRLWLSNRLKKFDTEKSKPYEDLIRENIWSLNENDRWSLYYYWLDELRLHLAHKKSQCEKKYKNLLRRKREAELMDNIECLELMKPKVLGITTTGAAKKHALLEAIKPKIIVVEEAAEVLEAHIVASLTKSCQQLILLGDHKQLKPNPCTYNLAKEYKLDVSLFERMIKNGVNCHTLDVQHRMKPNIASLISPLIYRNLKNHFSVESFSSIEGIPKNLYFITHSHHEEIDKKIESYRNKYEGEYMINLCKYLLLQGYQDKDITILTLYSAQTYYLAELQKKIELVKGVRITNVDNFQGEENKIILLSLVRSNNEENIGFLATENRVCVSLSRAKHGLYIIGNMDILKLKSTIWSEINQNLEKQFAIGPTLELKCGVHNHISKIQSVEDFEKVIDGGCYVKCEAVLPCSHACPKYCHVYPSHEDIKCLQSCLKVICCEEGHGQCPKQCWEECPPCPVLVEKIPPKCNHQVQIPCSKKIEEYQCQIMITETMEGCNHVFERYCYQDISECQIECKALLKCGHLCSLKCHVNDDPLHLKYLCKMKCEKKMEACINNHTCQKLCSEDCGKCLIKVEKTLDCGHVCHIECCKDPSMKCKKNCGKTLDCGHQCRKQCHQTCLCTEMVDKVVEECGHLVKTKCGSPACKSSCRRACEKVLQCGHPCKLKCGQDCECIEIVNKELACGHSTEGKCSSKLSASEMKELLKDCSVKCGEMLPCGHACGGTCGTCQQGRKHKECNEKCSKKLICGHRCESDCYIDCTAKYCSEKCLYKCPHSKGEAHCSKSCSPCKKKCTRKCKHKQCRKLCHEKCNIEPCYEKCDETLPCGHACIGYCGEPCPPLCFVCDNQEFTEYTKLQGLRFVILADCKHVIESRRLNKLFKFDPKKILRRCPKCQTEIVSTLRFSKHIKTFFKKHIILPNRRCFS